MNRSLQIVNAQHWERLSATERMGRAVFYIITVVAFIWALKKIEVIPEFLYDAPEQTADLFKRMWPFDWNFYPENIHPALIETFHIATLGTLISLLIAVPLAATLGVLLKHAMLAYRQSSVYLDVDGAS